MSDQPIDRRASQARRRRIAREVAVILSVAIPVAVLALLWRLFDGEVSVALVSFWIFLLAVVTAVRVRKV